MLGKPQPQLFRTPTSYPKPRESYLLPYRYTAALLSSSFPIHTSISKKMTGDTSSTMASLSISSPKAGPSAENSKEPESRYEPRYIDVGINLTDGTYQGYYHGRKTHEADLESVISRGQAVGCQKLMVTGSDYKHSLQAIELAEKYPGIIFATVGIHPCCASAVTEHITPQKTLQSLLRQVEDLALDGKNKGTVTAFGEIGLDYDRFFLSDKESQLLVFEEQLRIAERVDLPLFLHSRAAEEDFNKLLFAANLPRKGLVHSFTGTLEEMKVLVEHGYDIGINGCSLKTEENLAVVKEIPLERLQIETDGPWCEIRNSHASAKYLKTMPEYLANGVPKDVKKEKWQSGLRVKGRNEPCAIAGVAWVIAQVKGVEFEEVCERSWENSMTMFRFDEAAALQEKRKETDPPKDSA
ncbi:uncharacterized protein DFL_000265 [Arthrobotrys flagrans]|uniref:Uncharacterized protein n=1 Tax=Arthrobotrys flagrans TaxID=97331 RepID=A0A437AD80_ARTFL|nr:hypothetical protein DFL_000265 [Arthrobotrys flagrans]